MFMQCNAEKHNKMSLYWHKVKTSSDHKPIDKVLTKSDTVVTPERMIVHFKGYKLKKNKNKKYNKRKS